MYEEEKGRTDRLNDAVKVYIAFMTFILGFVVFKMFPPEETPVLVSAAIKSNIGIIYISLALISFTSFLISFVCTIFVLKIWKFERVCDPRDIVTRSLLWESENELISVIIADYSTAANRNHEINDRKSKLLSKALFSLVVGLAAFAICLFIFYGLPLIRGGV